MFTQERSEQMKLTSAEVKRVLTQFDGEAIPDNHPVVPQLNQLFGEHTFFLAGNGLNIMEPAAPGGGATKSAQVVNLADWSAGSPARLEPHEPQPTEVMVELGSKH
jgi:hypothetical protein